MPGPPQADLCPVSRPDWFGISTKVYTSRANSPLARTLAADPSALWSCFRDSLPLPPSQFAFALFRNLRPVTLPSASSSPVELFIGAHLNPADYGWAIEKSRRTMERMRQLTGTEYPLDKMTVCSGEGGGEGQQSVPNHPPLSTFS